MVQATQITVTDLSVAELCINVEAGSVDCALELARRVKYLMDMSKEVPSIADFLSHRLNHTPEWFTTPIEDSQAVKGNNDKESQMDQ